MALDELRDEDESFDSDGITYVVDKELLNRVKPIKIDYTSSAMGSGFSISSSMNAASGCGSSCSC
jgi:iron-sulfur cluster assembly protein